MGLFTGLVTAPIRAVIAVAEVIQEEADAQLNDPSAIRRELEEVARLRDEGAIDEDEAAEREDLLIRRLIAVRERPGPKERS